MTAIILSVPLLGLLLFNHLQIENSFSRIIEVNILLITCTVTQWQRQKAKSKKQEDTNSRWSGILFYGVCAPAKHRLHVQAASGGKMHIPDYAGDTVRSGMQTLARNGRNQPTGREQKNGWHVLPLHFRLLFYNETIVVRITVSLQSRSEESQSEEYYWGSS